MKCPYCNFEEDKVVDSRATKEGKAIRRRRECLSCTKRFTTYEYIETVPRTVSKNDGSKEPFDRSKLLASFYTACKKRPVSQNKLHEMVDDIESKLSEVKGEAVPSSFIGDLVLSALNKIDEVAYMRYASVYRNFKQVSEFVAEIDGMLQPNEAASLKKI